MYFPSYHLLYWAEHQQHPLGGLLIKIMHMAALRHKHWKRKPANTQLRIATARQECAQSASEQSQQHFLFFLTALQHHVKARSFSNQKLVPKLPAEHTRDTHQHQQTHSSLLSTSYTASLLTSSGIAVACRF